MYLMVGLLVSLNRKMAIAAAFLIIIPTGLFFSLLLSSVLNGSSIVVSETLEASLIRWSLERPGGSVDLSEEAVSEFSSAGMSSVFNVSIYDYYESDGGYGSQDVFYMRITVLGEVASGFVKSVHVASEEDYGPSIVDWFGNWQRLAHVTLENLTIDGYGDFGMLPGGSGLKAFADLESVSDPKSVSFQGFARWALYSPKNRTHMMNLKVEMTYYNGTAYRKLVQPIELEIYSDSNNSPDDAEEIKNGTSVAEYIGGYDRRDYYSIYLLTGENISVSVEPLKGALWYNVFVYDPTLNQKAWDLDTNEGFKTISLTADSDGFWVIEIFSKYDSPNCMHYSLKVSS